MLGRQFPLFDDDVGMPGHGSPTPMMDFRRRADEVGAKSSRYMDDKRSRFSNGELQMNPRGEQLPMFMSAREITAKYQPFDGDRNELQEERWDSRAGQDTYRSQTTGGGSNQMRYVVARGVAATDEPRFYRPYDREHTETDDELYSRKYEEASRTPREHAEYVREEYGGDIATPRKYYRGSSMNSEHLTDSPDFQRSRSRTNSDPARSSRHRTDSWVEHEEHPEGGLSLRDSVLRQGVKSPIRLGQTIGSMGKPEVVGGHHRLSVMQFHKPDTLMPVLHDESLRSAQVSGYQAEKSGKGYRYT